MIKILFTAVFFFFCASAYSQNLYYGGFSYLGEASLISKSFPYTEQLNKVEAGVSAFDVELRNKFHGSDLAKYGVVMGDLASVNDEDALGLTLALESELISVEKFDEQYKLLIQISAQIMIFDFKEMKVVATYPIDVQFTDSLEMKPSEEDIRKRVANLYFGDSKVNILDIFVSKIKNIDPKKQYANHLKVVNVSLSEKAVQVIGQSISEAQLIQSIGQNFTRYLSVNQSVSVLPFTKGHAIGNKLAGRYANGEVYMMEIPEPDYAIDITLTALKKKKFSQNSAGTAFVYAAQANFKFYEPLTEDTFYEGKLFNGATKKVPASQTSVNDWPSYNDTLLSLFDKLTRVLDKPDKRWFKKHSGNASNFKEFKSIKKVIEQCR
jgi:hypothetical protein